MIFKLNLFSKSSLLIIWLLISILVYIVVKHDNYKKTAIDLVPEHLLKYFMVLENNVEYAVNTTEEELLAKLEKINAQGVVRNWQKYKPVDSETPVIVIQVHRDLERLQHLVVSLALVSRIHTALLVFSHSFHDERINFLIRQIDFCMVLQIYYPKSVQLYPFDSPIDCTIQTRKTKIFCENERSAESKNHWWWTANVVFNQLAWSTTHKYMVIFIDEDSYVLPDLLHMLRFAKFSLNYISDADVLSFGRPLAMDLDCNKLIVDAWRPPYSKGLAFNRTTWLKIAALGSHYCQYDDTSWSYSLSHLFEMFSRGRVVMVACMAPRVLSTGVFRSGRHALESIWWKTSSDQLFSNKVQAVTLYGHDGRLLRNLKAPPHGNGGWIDYYDRSFCSDVLNATTPENDFHYSTWVSV